MNRTRLSPSFPFGDALPTGPFARDPPDEPSDTTCSTFMPVTQRQSRIIGIARATFALRDDLPEKGSSKSIPVGGISSRGELPPRPVGGCMEQSRSAELWAARVLQSPSRIYRVRLRPADRPDRSGRHEEGKQWRTNGTSGSHRRLTALHSFPELGPWDWDLPGSRPFSIPPDVGTVLLGGVRPAIQNSPLQRVSGVAGVGVVSVWCRVWCRCRPSSLCAVHLFPCATVTSL